MLKAVIFDFFGVVISDGFELLVQQLEAENPHARKDIFDVIRRGNLGLSDTASTYQTLETYLTPLDKDWRKKVSSGEVQNLQLIDWVKQLHQKYKTALLSNAGSGSLKRRIDPSILDDIFDEIIVSADVGMIKPDTQIYALTAERLGVETKECIFFDDRQDHVDGAVMAGMSAFKFTSLTQAKADFDNTVSLS